MDARRRRPLGSTGLRVTQLGFGAAALGNLYTVVDPGQARQTVARALEGGIRFFDTAPFYGYGLSERRLGDALRECPREDYVLCTKVGRLLRPRPSGDARADQGFADALPFDPVFDYSYDGVMRCFEESLQRLGNARIDVLLLHDIGRLTHGDAAHTDVFKTAMEGGYRALTELRSSGAIAALGLGVNEWQVCSEAMAEADFDCFLLAGRYTLLEQTPLEQFLPVCRERGISVIVGGPYNSGILASKPSPGARYDYAAAAPEILARALALHRVCESHGVPLPAAALQFPLLHPAVAAVIPGARSADEVAENLAYLAHEIPDTLWRDLRSEGLLHEAAPTSNGGAHA